MTYAQNLWTVREAREMIDGWIGSTNLVVPPGMKIEVLNKARVNQWRLADAGMVGNIDNPEHTLRFWLPKIVFCAARRGVDYVEIFRDTVLHEFAHAKHHAEITELVRQELRIRRLGNGSAWGVYRELTKGKSYHSGHGEGWRSWCRRTGATPRATVETQIRALGGTLTSRPLNECLEYVQGYPIPKKSSNTPTPVRAWARQAVAANRSDHVREGRRPTCSDCFTMHGAGQTSCY